MYYWLASCDPSHDIDPQLRKGSVSCVKVLNSSWWEMCSRPGLLPSKSALLTEKLATKLNWDKIYFCFKLNMYMSWFFNTGEKSAFFLNQFWFFESLEVFFLNHFIFNDLVLLRQCCQKDQTFAAIIDFLKSWFCKRQHCNTNIILTTCTAEPLLVAVAGAASRNPLLTIFRIMCNAEEVLLAIRSFVANVTDQLFILLIGNWKLFEDPLMLSLV